MPQIGEITRWDAQSDIWQQRYRYTRHLGGNRWEIEILPVDDEMLEKMFNYWGAAERGEVNAYYTPIWDKTWAECTGDERPQRVRNMTAAEMLDRDIQRATDAAGRRMEIIVVSRGEWAKHF